MVNNLKSFEMPISQTDEWCIRKELRKSLCITIIAPTKTRLHSTTATIKCSNHNLTFWMYKCRTTGKQQNIEYWNDFVDLRCAFYSYTKYHIYSAPFFSFFLAFLPRFSTKCTEHTPRISNLFGLRALLHRLHWNEWQIFIHLPRHRHSFVVC